MAFWYHDFPRESVLGWPYATVLGREPPAPGVGLAIKGQPVRPTLVAPELLDGTNLSAILAELAG